MRNSEVTGFEITVFGSEGVDASAVGADFFVREFNFDVTIFARVLAKIAHGLATLTLGVDGFNPLLPSYILNAERNPFWLVGGYREKAPASHQDSLPASIRALFVFVTTFEVNHSLLWSLDFLLIGLGVSNLSRILLEHQRTLL